MDCGNSSSEHNHRHALRVQILATVHTHQVNHVQIGLQRCMLLYRTPVSSSIKPQLRKFNYKYIISKILFCMSPNDGTLKDHSWEDFTVWDFRPEVANYNVVYTVRYFGFWPVAKTIRKQKKWIKNYDKNFWPEAANNIGFWPRASNYTEFGPAEAQCYCTVTLDLKKIVWNGVENDLVTIAKNEKLCLLLHCNWHSH